MIVNYEASPTMCKFHKSDAFVRSLFGPIGSGKSVACVIEMLRISFNVQLPDYTEEKYPFGVRKSRWVVVRNTYRELIDTTIQTFFDWIPEELGIFHKQDMKFTLVKTLPDGTTAHIEFIFRALDKPSDIKKLLSLEVTGGWLNEAREIPKQIMDMLIGRLGRYPRKKDGKGGATRHCLLMDTNPPDSDHWYYKLFEIDKPSGYEIFYQPSGTSPEAENIRNLPDGYYEKMQSGKDKEWINVYVHGKYGFVQDGKPVWPQYNDDIHSTDEQYIPNPMLPIHIGIDFGLTPAATLGQQDANGRWFIFDEYVTFDMDVKTFGGFLKRKLNKDYPNFEFTITGDPAGDFRSQTDSMTPFQILAGVGIQAAPAWTNDVVVRLEAVSGTMGRMVNGRPGFIICPGAPMIRKACAGGYKYRRMQVSGSEKYSDVPDKGRYSHVADSLQYLMLGGGEGDNVYSSNAAQEKIEYVTDPGTV